MYLAGRNNSTHNYQDAYLEDFVRETKLREWRNVSGTIKVNVYPVRSGYLSDFNTSYFNIPDRYFISSLISKCPNSNSDNNISNIISTEENSAYTCEV